jgi:DNA-binding response OmpR family regulator
MNNEKKKILVAEDDPGILDMVSMMLEDEGYVVKKTANGKTVPDLMKFHPDLLLLDIWMSGMDGRDICKKIKSEEDTKNIPVIIMSANKDTETIAKECGADNFIAKPFEMDEMITKVKQYIN